MIFSRWKRWEPKKPGYYVLEFSGGDRFVVIRAFYEIGDSGKEEFVMEDMNNGGYVNDVVDIIIRYCAIPNPN